MHDYYLWLIVVLSIVFIILSGTLWRWHPFLSLLIAALGFGVLAGIPVVQVIAAIGNGFGSLLGAIGLIVVLGSILGTILEESGSVQRLGQVLHQRTNGRPSLGLSMLGLVLGIPVFCDSGFIILVSLARSLSTSTGTALPTLTLSLSGGLYTSHTLVPPTPGPVAAAGNLGITASLGLIILLGIIVSVPVVLIAHYYAKRIGHGLQYELPDILQKQSPHLGSLYYAVVLLVLPVVLIALAAILSLQNITGKVAEVILFLGNPMIALLIAVSFGLMVYRSRHVAVSWIDSGIRNAGPILLLTGAGGAFGAVLKASPLSDMLSAWAQHQTLSGIGFLLIGFFISAFFKTAQGSSTSAMVIVSAIIAPLTIEAGFSDPIELSLLVLAIGSGAMTVSHANDSYFWVVSQFSGFDLRSAYRGITIMSLLQGVAALLMVLLLYYILV